MATVPELRKQLAKLRRKHRAEEKKKWQQIMDQSSREFSANMRRSLR